MTDIERVVNLIDWMVFTKKITSRRQLSEKMGYKESYLSQILNGKVPVTEKFLKKLSITGDGVNFNWLLNGEGEMLTSSDLKQQIENDTITIPKEVWSVIKSQADSLRIRDESLQSKDNQIDELIKLIKQQMEEVKKINVQKEENAISAAVGL